MKNHFFNACVKTYVKRQMILSDARNSLKNEKGATAVEYALVTAVVVIGVVAAATVMFEPLQGFFKAAIGKVTGFIDE